MICEIRSGGVDAEAGYWPVPDISPRIAATVIAVEDHRFYRHPGVDFIAVGRAMIQNIGAHRRVSGASTIAMQLARLQQPADRTYWNKLREMADAVIMTARIGRDGVLDHYLRLAPYGNGIRGIGYAARVYFDKPLNDLSWAEIAFLSAIPQQPGRMNPRTAEGRIRVVRRARRILEIVRNQDMMTPAEFQRAYRQVAGLTIRPQNRRPADAIHLALHFQSILDAYDPGDDPGKCRISTAVDLDVQAVVAEQIRLCVDAWSVSGARNAAVMVIDAGTREVIASVGSTDYFDRARHGAIDYTRVKRSPGSTLKPFIYALAMDNGYLHANSMLGDGRVLSGGFRNYDGEWLGDIPVSQALASSRNVPAVHVLRKTGIYRTYGCFADLNLHSYEHASYRYGLGMAIGGLPVTLENLAQAYTVFTRNGTLSSLRYCGVQKQDTPRRIFSSPTVALINRFLSDPMARLPSFPRMGHLEYDYPVAVKTGTSEGCRDAWTAAWSPEYLVVTWIGRPDGYPMRGVSGYRAAAELTHAIMDYLHDDSGTASGAHFPAGDTCPPNPLPESSGTVRIISPEDRSIYYFDPETPRNLSSLVLAAEVSPDIQWITWEVDGVPYKTIQRNTVVSWPMVPGRHTIKATSGHSTEDTVCITVQ